MQREDGPYFVKLSTKGESKREVLPIGNSDMTLRRSDDSGECVLVITGQTCKLQVRRCQSTKEQVPSNDGEEHYPNTKCGIACEVFDPLFNEYSGGFKTETVREYYDISTTSILQATNNPGMEEYIMPEAKKELIPLILYLDADTNHEPFEVECMFLTGWVDQRYQGTITPTTYLSNGWHHVVLLVFERLGEAEAERIGLLHLDVRTWLAAERTIERLVFS